MLISKVAKRYAQGLLSFTEETGQTQAVAGDMVNLVKLIGESKDLQSFLATPILDEKKKSSVSKELFKSYSQISQNIILLVIKHGREKELQNIAQGFVDLVDEMSGVQRVTLTVASPLSDPIKNQILGASHLVQKDKKSDVKTIVDPRILGGYILRVGDQQIDASVKNKLAKLQKEFQLN